jgi:FkbM family methyltransferase
MTDAHLPLRVRLLGPALRNTRPAVLATWLKRLLRIKRQVVRADIGAFFVDPVSHLGNFLIRDGHYEPDMEDTLRKHIRPGGVFVDVGANEGYFSVLGGQLVGPGGRVVAVEPQARLAPVIAENTRLNGLTNVTVIATAVSNAEGTADLFLAPDTNTGASGLSQPNRYRVPAQPVRTTTLARLLADTGVGPIDLLKMDIEGIEYEAVFGSPDVFLNGRVRAFAMELHPSIIRSRGHDPQELVTFLHRHGYQEDRSTGKRVFVWGPADG